MKRLEIAAPLDHSHDWPAIDEGVVRTFAI